MDEARRRHMLRAVELSAENMRKLLGGPFGAVIVRDGAVIAEGTNRVTTAVDPTAHAEVVAIREACKQLGAFSLEGCEIYTSCEPCPMCLAAIYWARLDAIYYANDRDDAARVGFDDDHIYREIALPVSERAIAMRQLQLPEAEAVFEEWDLMEDKVPY